MKDMKNREKIKLTSEQASELYYEGNHSAGYKLIEKQIDYSDLAKGYTSGDIIIQRISDEKFFMAEYMEHSDGIDIGENPSYDDSNCIFYEVFRGNIKKITYHYV